MSNTKKFGQYICPHNKSVPQIPSISALNRNSKATVSGSYCKNNCELYMNGCKLFKNE